MRSGQRSWQFLAIRYPRHVRLAAATSASRGAQAIEPGLGLLALPWPRLPLCRKGDAPAAIDAEKYRARSLAPMSSLDHFDWMGMSGRSHAAFPGGGGRAFAWIFPPRTPPSDVSSGKDWLDLVGVVLCANRHFSVPDERLSAGPRFALP